MSDRTVEPSSIIRSGKYWREKRNNSFIKEFTGIIDSPNYFQDSRNFYLLDVYANCDGDRDEEIQVLYKNTIELRLVRSLAAIPMMCKPHDLLTLVYDCVLSITTKA